MALAAVGHSTKDPSSIFRPHRALLLCVFFSGCTIALVWSTTGSHVRVQADLGTAAYLVVLESVLVLVSVPIALGRLNLSAVATQVAGMLLPTELAAGVGLFAGLWSYSVSPLRRRTPWQVKAGLWGGYALWTSAGAAVHSLVGSAVVGDVLVVLVNTTGNWIGVALVFNAVHAEPVLSVWKRNFSTPWFVAFGAFGVASLLMAHVLRTGGPASFLYATLVPILALSLRSQINLGWLGVLVRRSVEQVTEQSEYLVELEGGLHDLRNLLMAAQLALEVHADPSEVRNIITEAIAIVRRVLSRQEDGRSHFEVIDVHSFVNSASSLIGSTARQRSVRVEIDLPPEPVFVYGDAVLLAELMTNLLLNAIDATTSNGVVRVKCVVRRAGVRAVSVADGGKGFRVNESLGSAAFARAVADGGHGIGLRWCQVVALRHLGRLTLDASGPAGSIVTLSLPPPQQAQQRLARLQRTVSVASGTGRAE